MGIYDREYYRKEGPSFLGSFSDRGIACKWLIGINVALFFLQLVDYRGAFGTPGGLTRAFELNSGVAYYQYADRIDELRPSEQALVTPGVLQGQIWRLVSYAFLHDPNGFMHILFNMLFLWWFGADLEDRYGTREFVAFYLISAVLGAIVFVLLQVVGLIGLNTCIGASGAVTAILVLSCLLYPGRVIYVFLIVPIPIWFFVIYQVGSDAYTLVSGRPSGTAVSVHLTGAAFAWAYYQFGFRLTSMQSRFTSWRRQLFRPKLRVYREQTEPTRSLAKVPAAPRSDHDEQLEAKLDAVLEKVARTGQNSLNEAERQILMRASEIYKKKRS